MAMPPRIRALQKRALQKKSQQDKERRAPITTALKAVLRERGSYLIGAKLDADTVGEWNALFVQFMYDASSSLEDLRAENIGVLNVKTQEHTGERND